MIAVYERKRKAERSLDAKMLRIQAITKAGRIDPVDIPIDFDIGADWARVSSELGEGDMIWRQSYNLASGEHAVSCHWQEGAMLLPHKHPHTDEYIYVIRGTLRNLTTGDIIESGENIQPENVLAGISNAQPYIIPAGKTHFIQALEDDTWFIVKFVRTDD